MDVTSAVTSGDRRRSLEAIRDALAVQLQYAEGRDAAPLAKELRATIAELESLPGAREGSASDELAKRRRARRSAAGGAAAAGQ